MISECFNPVCRKKLDYLRTGQVVRVVRENGPNVEIEHFWLCGECRRTHDLRLMPNGQVVLYTYSAKTEVASGRVLRWLRRAEVPA